MSLRSNSHKAHFNSLKQVLKIAKENKLKLNKDKCEVAIKELTFLGDRLTSHGVVLDDRKVSAITNMKVPKTYRGFWVWLPICVNVFQTCQKRRLHC